VGSYTAAEEHSAEARLTATLALLVLPLSSMHLEADTSAPSVLLALVMVQFQEVGGRGCGAVRAWHAVGAHDHLQAEAAALAQVLEPLLLVVAHSDLP